jgi:hypothetical protein
MGGRTPAGCRTIAGRRKPPDRQRPKHNHFPVPRRGGGRRIPPLRAHEGMGRVPVPRVVTPGGCHPRLRFGTPPGCPNSDPHGRIGRSFNHRCLFFAANTPPDAPWRIGGVPGPRPRGTMVNLALCRVDNSTPLRLPGLRWEDVAFPGWVPRCEGGEACVSWWEVGVSPPSYAPGSGPRTLYDAPSHLFCTTSIRRNLRNYIAPCVLLERHGYDRPILRPAGSRITR